MSEKKQHFDEVFQNVKYLAEKFLSNSDFGGEIVSYGTQNIINLPEFRDSESLKKLLAFFEEKTLIYEIVEKCIKEPTVKIFIGSEITDSNSDLSLVTKPYKRDDKIIGTLGVIGPKRMRYPEIIPVVDYTAEIISKLLSEIGGIDE
jgi:heat-inducible transcriptional repressor